MGGGFICPEGSLLGIGCSGKDARARKIAVAQHPVLELLGKLFAKDNQGGPHGKVSSAAPALQFS